MPSIHFIPDDKTVTVEAHETILQSAMRAGIPLTHDCGGKARCTTCRILILDGAMAYVSPRNEKEAVLAGQLGFEPIIRLACQTLVTGDIRIRRLVLDDSDISLTRLAGPGSSTASVGSEKYLAILFADIRNFTHFAEKQLPYDVIHFLNRYFYHMRQVVERNKGYINNYMGDGLLALFGLDDPANAAERAVHAGLEMLREMENLQPYIKQTYGQNLQMGVGIHYGDVVIGNLGNAASERSMVIGDAVNVASRIESCNKIASTRLLVSAAVYDQLGDRVTVGKKSNFTLKGKEDEFQLYEILSLR
ncbi:MAG TPA: adenylate/guanylate cyclase domain-containing protein [Anaerolineales bacterium]